MLKICGGYYEIYYLLWCDKGNHILDSYHCIKDRSYQGLIQEVKRISQLKENNHKVFNLEIVLWPERISHVIQFSYIDGKCCVHSNLCPDCNYNVFIVKLEQFIKAVYPVGRHYMDRPLTGYRLKVKKDQ